MQPEDVVLHRSRYDNVNISGGAVHLGDQYFHVHNHVLPQSEAARVQLLNSIRFPEMNARFNEISTTKYDTFEWFLNADFTTDPWTSGISKSRDRQRCHSQMFRQWLKTGQGFFLIKGKPGSGKSTFMKFLFQHGDTTTLLQAWSLSSLPLILFHSFWMAGTALQSNLKGFLASVLSQLITKNEYCPEGDVTLAIHQRHSLTDWSEPELLQLLRSILPKLSSYVCLFVDGLDEFDGRNDFDELYDILCDLSTDHGYLKICVSTRPIPHILHYLQHFPNLTLQDLTYDDIYDHTYNTLRDRSNRMASSTTINNSLHAITECICLKSDGVFLWVHYVLSNVCRGIISYDSVDHLLKRIESLPSAMEELYKQMWRTQNALHSIHSGEAVRIFQFGKYFPMPLFQLASALNTSIYTNYTQKLQRIEDQYLASYCREFSARLSARTAGFIEIVPRDDKKDIAPVQPGDQDWSQLKVQYFHRTVHDFFQDNKSLVSAALEGNVELSDKSCDSLWIQSYLTCLVQNVFPLVIDSVLELLASPAWLNQLSLPLMNVVDEFCGQLVPRISDNDHMRGNNGWLLRLKTEADAHLGGCCDYNGLVTFVGHTNCLSYRMTHNGTNWSPYYKGHLAMCLTPYLNSIYRFRDRDGGDFFLSWQILRTSEADLKSFQLVLRANTSLIVRSPTTQMVLRFCVDLLNGYSHKRTLDHCDKILEALAGLTTDEEHYATLYWNYEHHRWSDREPVDPHFVVVLTYRARDVHEAVLKSLSSGEILPKLVQDSQALRKQQTKRVKKILSSSLHALPCEIHFYRSIEECGFTYFRCPIDRRDTALGAAFRDTFRIFQLPRDHWSCQYPTTFVYDIDSRIHWKDVKDWIRPLDPEQQVEAHEWKEKGILREYYAHLSKSEGLEIDEIQD